MNPLWYPKKREIDAIVSRLEANAVAHRRHVVAVTDDGIIQKEADAFTAKHQAQYRTQDFRDTEDAY